MNKPLHGVRILDLTHMLSGPFGAMILADLGAETVKVEPLKGEGTRKLLAQDPDHSIGGMGAYFITLNRNKKSVAVDLKSEHGRSVFYDLVRHSDVVIDNFAAGVTRRLMIDYDRLAEVNPGIVTCSVTGFGSDGPGSTRPAYDQIAQALGGGMSITGFDADHPVRAGIPIGDLGGGMFAAIGIQSALLERANSGRGQHVDISMLDCQVSMLNYMATMYFLSGLNPEPIGNSHFVHVPYNTFHTADGFIVIAVVADTFWPALKTVVEIPEFDDEKYDRQPGRWEDREMINRRLNEVLQTRGTAHWVRQLTEARVPCAAVNRFSETLSDEQILHRGMIVDLSHPDGSQTRGPGNPVQLSRSSEACYSAAPWLGQHTDEILREVLKYDDDRIEQLKSVGAIA
ncbi:MAG: CaiB/BaiF CoA transferase family protein [Lysobacterales bacterium]